jgi:hypothetical protein
VKTVVDWQPTYGHEQQLVLSPKGKDIATATVQLIKGRDALGPEAQLRLDNNVLATRFGQPPLLCRRAQVGPVGDKIGSPRPPVDQGEPRGEPHPRLIRAHAAQGGVTLGPEQGELGANFCYLGGSLRVPHPGDLGDRRKIISNCDS